MNCGDSARSPKLARERSLGISSEPPCKSAGPRSSVSSVKNRPGDVPSGRPWCRRTREQVARLPSCSKLLQPMADRIRMQDKSPGRLGCRPLPKPHDLKDLKTMRRCIMRSLFRRKPLALLAEDGQFPLEQPCIPRGRISGRGETNHRRRMRNQTRPREHVTLGDGYGDRVNQMEDRRNGPRRHDLSLSSGLDDHANRSLETDA